MKRNQENDQENIQVMDKEEILQKSPKNVNSLMVDERNFPVCYLPNSSIYKPKSSVSATQYSEQWR